MAFLRAARDGLRRPLSLETRNRNRRTSGRTMPTLHRNLRADLDHAPGRDLEIVGRVVGRAREADEQTVLPARHPGMGRRLERAAREEERRRHDIELPAELACDRE